MPGYEKLQIPVNGLSENQAYDEQPPTTTREMDNVRVIDPATGRTRLSQRAGSSKWTSSAMPSKVLTLCQIASGESQTTYADDADPDVDWDAATPSELDTPAVQVDRQGNVYAIDGRTSLVKYNPDGREFFRFNFPALDDENQIRALLVDAFDVVFAGTSDGADQTLSRLWAYIPAEDNKLTQLWEIEPGSYVEQVALNEDQTLLYTIQNDPGNWKAYLRVYQGIGSSTPSLAWERDVPYPANGLAVKRSGDALVTSEPFSNRGQSPFAGETTTVSEDWTPLELTSAEERIWAWLDAKEIANQPEGYIDADEVLIWRDKSGNGRHMYANSGAAPFYVEHTLAGLPGVRFDGSVSEMFSLAATSASPVAAGSQKTLIPPYTGAGWLLCMAVRVPAGTTGTSIFNQDRSSSLYLNVVGNSTPTAAAFTAASGRLGVRLNDYTPSPTMPVAGDHANNAEVAIVTLKFDHGGGANSVLWQVNGDPLTLNTSIAGGATPLLPTRFGKIRNAAGTDITAAQGLLPFNGDILEILVLRDYNSGTIVEHQNYPTVGLVAGSDTELQRIVGYMGHRWGVSDQLDDGEPTYPHPYELTNGPPASSTQSGINTAKLYRTGALLSKFGANQGVLKWVLADNDNNPELAANDVSGIGYGVAVNSFGEIYTVGPTKGTDTSTVRKIRDGGDAPILDSTEGTADQAAWVASWTGETMNYHYPRMAVDSFDNVYVPKDTTTDTAALHVYRRQSNSGLVQVEYTKTLASSQRGRAVAVDPNTPTTEEYSTAVQRAQFVALGTENRGGSPAVGSITIVNAPADGDTITISDGINTPVTFEFDPNNDGVAGSNVPVVFTPGDEENCALILALQITAQNALNNLDITTTHTNPSNFQRLVNDVAGTVGNVAITASLATPGDVLYAGMTGGSDTSDTETVHRLQAVTATVNAGSPRSFKTVAVSGTGIYTVASGGAPSLKSSPINASAQFVSCARLFGKVYLTDGISRGYPVYDPATDAVTTYQSQVGGSPPLRCKLLSSWRQRLVFLRPESDPHMWHMTAAGNPLDNDLFPPVVTPASAIAGNLPERAGLVPDIINAFVPYSDDIAIFGCDHSIYVLRGDPQSDGQFDRVSDTVGMAFGDSWAKDPAGFVYFFGAQGGVFQMAPNGAFQRLSLYRIERQLQDVDLSTYDMRLAWNYQDEGLHVFQTKKGVDATLVAAWFWDKKNDCWSRDTWALSTVQPSCVFVHDGDAPGDRHVLIGCEDGYVRKLDREAQSDDGQVIGSAVTLGPYQLGGEYEMRISRLAAVLAETGEHVDFELSVSDNPETTGTVVASGSFDPGRNPTVPCRARGSYVWVRLFNYAVESRWSLERLAAQAAPSGRRRVRA